MNQPASRDPIVNAQEELERMLLDQRTDELRKTVAALQARIAELEQQKAAKRS